MSAKPAAPEHRSSSSDSLPQDSSQTQQEEEEEGKEGTNGPVVQMPFQQVVPKRRPLSISCATSSRIVRWRLCQDSLTSLCDSWFTQGLHLGLSTSTDPQLGSEGASAPQTMTAVSRTIRWQICLVVYEVSASHEHAAEESVSTLPTRIFCIPCTTLTGMAQ